MKKIFFLFLLLASKTFSQEIDITDALKQIESGNIRNAKKTFQDFSAKNPADPSVIFLGAVLTTNGGEALKKYSIVYELHPKSNYADASLYRIFSYYYAMGLYKKAETYLNKLKMEYPNSPYIKSADRNIPDETIAENVSEPQTKPSDKFNYTIQAGAFLNADNAKKLCEQLKADGYTCEITTKEIGGSILNVVNIGKFANEEETKSVLDYLSDKYKINGRTVFVGN
ncbi:MAG: SPOR domain-containing protein [Ignavibacteriales bacterium]|nr:SPOR domain-containing protein [Ignavibacteriales bacterium]